MLLGASLTAFFGLVHALLAVPVTRLTFISINVIRLTFGTRFGL